MQVCLRRKTPVICNKRQDTAMLSMAKLPWRLLSKICFQCRQNWRHIITPPHPTTSLSCHNLICCTPLQKKKKKSNESISVYIQTTSPHRNIYYLCRYFVQVNNVRDKSTTTGIELTPCVESPLYSQDI